VAKQKSLARLPPSEVLLDIDANARQVVAINPKLVLDGKGLSGMVSNLASILCQVLF